MFAWVPGFPGGASGKEPTWQCRRHKRCGFHPWVGKVPWRREWQLTLVLLPGESHGQRSLAGYSPWGLTESDMTEVTEHACALGTDPSRWGWVPKGGNRAAESDNKFVTLGLWTLWRKVLISRFQYLRFKGKWKRMWNSLQILTVWVSDSGGLGLWYGGIWTG